MRTKFYFKHLNTTQKKFLESYVEKKNGRLKKFLKKIPDDSWALDVKTERFSTKEAFIVELILHTPKKKFIAKEDDHTLQEAVDFAVEKLIRQLRKQFSKQNEPQRHEKRKEL